MTDAESLRLPEPHLQDKLAQTMQQRRSVREFAPKPLSLETAARLLWAAQGISSPDGLRTTERIFQFDLSLPADAAIPVAGGRVYVRFDHGAEPLARKVLENMEPAQGLAMEDVLKGALKVLVK